MKSFNKSLLIKILLIAFFACIVVLFLTVLVNSINNEKQNNVPQIEYVQVRYSYDENCCEFIGKDSQTIIKGSDAESVIIKPKMGYRFVGWFDARDLITCFDKENLTRQEKNVQHNVSLMAKFVGPIYYAVEFLAESGGTIEGATNQTILYGGDGEMVTAVPDEGYRFVKWSDGETEAVRENLSLNFAHTHLSIYAKFERYSRKFEYVYNGGTSKTGETEVEINLDNIDEITFPIPEREGCQFEGWYSDWHHEILVADSKGKIVVDNEWLLNDGLFYASESDYKLYAKWSAENELPTYKILMIYFTEVHGDFKYYNAPPDADDFDIIRVDYVMSEKHRKICNLITEYMGKYLNAAFNETVRFQVDEYFTTEPISEKEFIGPWGNYSCGPIITGNDGVQETKEIIQEYDSVLSSFSLCSWDNGFKLIGNSGGTASSTGKYANVGLDWIFGNFEYCEIEDLADYTFPPILKAWEMSMISYIHEFIHTVEFTCHINEKVGLHSTIKYYAENLTGDYYIYDAYIPFLLNKFEVDNGETWGIPYEFWLNYKK